jgi:hypothetical protein
VLLTEQADFVNALLESIDETIGALFGQNVLEALYLNLKNKRSIRREEISNQLPTLSVVLQQYFGSSAATIGRSIARRLYSKLGFQFTNRDDYQLIDYVRDAKNKFRQV